MRIHSIFITIKSVSVYSNKQSKYEISSDNIIKQIGKAGLPYTCTDDCLMVVTRFSCTSVGEAYIQVNGINIISNNSTDNHIGFTMPLNKGDIVYANNVDKVSSNSRFSFYKAK